MNYHPKLNPITNQVQQTSNIFLKSKLVQNILSIDVSEDEELKKEVKEYLQNYLKKEII